ncbi:nucleoside 2-deoxyribosyltransferase [Solibacillus silvestris StLB046]|uniref:Nucleoside 2-deoxyribosyltransferase n=1 Tax=Solibacillus silvestris (strain StLB046) TaxID=1002809 RepID=F2F2M0_SOLSS|nr:DUF2577 domain-containing protein [Solibacillus silvestris]BAK15858.1 nucleoside 2-deoxyribosyltransferase [Solibacillus silvestris StLB046]
MEESINELAGVIESVAKSVPKFEGFIIGTVISPPEDLRVSIDEAIILDKTNLIIAAHVLNDYEREFEIYEGDIQFNDTNMGVTNVAANHSHTIESLNVDSQTLKAKGKFIWTDTLKKDDLVILIPSENQQMYILIDKAVEL